MSENIQKLLDTHWYDPKFEVVIFYGAPDNPMDCPKTYAIPGMFKPFERTISLSEDEFKTILDEDFQKEHRVRIGSKEIYREGTVRLILKSITSRWNNGSIRDMKMYDIKTILYEIGLYFSV